MGTITDILLVNPNNRIVSPFAGVEPPLWAGLIASHYKQQGSRVAILDAEANDFTVEQTVEAIKDTNPRMIIIVVMGNNPSASSTPKMLVTKKLVEQLKGYNIAVTGLHPSALPYETEEELGVPVLKGKAFDGMPSIPWELLPMDKYIAHNWHCLDGSPRSPYVSVYTSLGCPYSCEFCNIHALYGGKHQVWYREPIEVAREIDLLVEKYKVKNIKLWDECFSINPKHIEDICNLLIDRNYNLNVWAYARVDTVTTEMLKKMRQAGIKWVCYGFEAGSDSVLSKSNKKANKIQAQTAVKITHYAGINTLGNFMFGLPGDTKKTMQETLDFAKSLEIEYANFYTAMPYPGSKPYKDSKDWANYSQWRKSYSKADKFRDKAFIGYFTDPSYQARIKDKFGTQAIEHIGKMLKFGKPVTRSN